MPQLLPPRDLLEQVQGVESGLRRGRGARATGFLVGVIQLTILLANSDWLNALLNADWGAVAAQWPLFICLFVLALSVVAITWTRFWLKESQQPFRYTYSIAPFVPVAGDDELKLLVPIHADLRERLSQRIRRLSLLEGQEAPAKPIDAQPPEGGDAAQAGSHVHIAGYYAIRKRPPDTRWLAEITAWVRVGGPERPAVLGEPVRYALTLPNGDSGRASPDLAPAITREQYEAILERAYFSIATEVYRQIKEDVARKIELLPNRWFRASALFHEARDYARSNTLDAYNQARTLYESALEIYDPASAILPTSWLRRQPARLRLFFRQGISWFRRRVSGLIPRLGRPEVLAARAQVGYANTLLDFWTLAALSGLRASPIYEAVPIAKRAVERLELLSPDVAGRDESLFDARVALAFAHAGLDARDDGRELLDRAAAEAPLRVDRDARYLFVRAQLEDRLRSCIALYQRAIELDPRFEAAQFQLAANSELVWRMRGTLERSVAQLIFEQYERVLSLNPGNITAWANTGYMYWLLEEPKLARQRYETGRRFKEIKQETYVAGLDHGLARIAAERGEFVAAYRYYFAAVSAIVAQGWAMDSFANYHFDRMSAAMLDRFRKYVEAVRREHAWQKNKTDTTTRVRDSVLAFVLYDFSNACVRFYRRTHNYSVLEEAYNACREAIELDDRFVLPVYHLYKLEGYRTEFVGTAPDGRLLDRVEELVPGWPEAAHTLLRWHGGQALEARSRLEKVQAQADERHEEAQKRTDELKEVASVVMALDEQVVPKPVSLEDPSRLAEKAQRLKGDAGACLEAATEREEKARKLAKTLLPHSWLWDGDELDWNAVSSKAASRELRWERSLEPFHVKVLMAWCQSLAEKSEPNPHLDELLNLIESRFLPCNLDLIALRRKRAGTKDPDEKYQAQIDRVVDYWLANDDSTFAALSHLDVASTKAYDEYVRVARLKGLSPYLYHWLGRKLREHWERTGNQDARAAALEVLTAAPDVEQPEALVELAAELDKLDCKDDKRLDDLYGKAAASPEVNPRLYEPLKNHFESHGDYERVLRVLVRARNADKDSPRPFRTEAYYATEIARVQFELGQYQVAREELERMPAAAGRGEDWRARFAGSVNTDTDTTVARLRDWLGAQQRAAIREGNAAAAQDAASGALELALARRPGLWAEGQGGRTARQPIVVDAHPDHFAGASDQFVSGMKRAINLLRDQIREETGVSIPGCRLRRKPELPARGYRIRLHDVPIAQGTVPAGEHDPVPYITARAGDAIRGRLSTFVDLQTLDAWADDEERQATMRKELGTEGQRCAFVSLLKRLADDDVPLDIGTVLESWPHRPPDAGPDRPPDAAELSKLAAEVRQTMADRLPGRGLAQIELPDELELTIAGFASSDEPRPERAIPPELLTEFRTNLSALLHGGGDKVLVVSKPDVRRTVRRIVALDMPATPVLSRAEVPEPSLVSSVTAWLPGIGWSR